jgi:hypothetical protein
MSRGPKRSGPKPLQPVIRLASSHPSETPAALQVKACLSDARAIAMAFAACNDNER